MKTDTTAKANTTRAVLFALAAAALYALSVPGSKLLLADVPSAVVAGILYLGAGVGVGIMRLVRGLFSRKTASAQVEKKLTRGDLPYVVLMVLLDIAAPLSLMFGLSLGDAASASLLGNFEIVATAVIALCLFKEKISPRLWLAIGLVTVSSILLSLDGAGLGNGAATGLFSAGSLLVLLACVFWGFENNCTKMISGKDPLEIVTIKGIFSGTGSLIVAFIMGERLPAFGYIAAALLLGFVAYGLSIMFYIYAQRELGAAKTGAYYAVAPFIGVLLAFCIFRETPGPVFAAALVIMAAGAYFASTENKIRKVNGHGENGKNISPR